MRSAVILEQYNSARDQLQNRIAEKIRKQMNSLVGNMESADLLLVAADGKKLPAHECILRTRAPGFYQRHIEATVSAMGSRVDGRLREVAIGDIDSAGLEFFIHSVYTEDEIAQFPSKHNEVDERRRLEDETPTAGRPPLSYSLPSGYSSSPTPCHVIPSFMSSSSHSHSMGSYTTSESPLMMSSTSMTSSSLPQMTSFRDLATGSPMNSSIYSLGGRSEVTDIPEEDEEIRCEKIRSRGDVSMSKFIRLDSVETPDTEKDYIERKNGGPKQIFPMFIGFSDADGIERSYDTVRSGRTIMTKRLSMTSLTSLTSIDMTPSNDGQTLVPDRAPCSRLASDLMQMYLNNEDTDVIIRTESGDLHAHRYSRNSIHFLLSFLYGGLTSIPDEPCASCVSAVFDAMPQLASIRCMKNLYEEALAWQAKHFARIWKGRVFIYINERWQKECYEAVIQQMDDETVIDIILGCERLQVALPRSKAESAAVVLSMVDDVLEVAMQFLIHSFHLVITSKAFQQQGKGLALNLGLLEDLLPTLIHSLSADVAIKTYKGLSELLAEIQSVPPASRKGLNIPIDEWSPRFASLVRRMYELVDKHLLHYAASVVKADAWNLLSEREQSRIQETGLFVELRQPKSLPPRLSSHNRTYKRSVSAGVHFSPGYFQDRSRSTERGRPLSTIQQSGTVTNNMEIDEHILPLKTSTDNEGSINREKQDKQKSALHARNTEEKIDQITPSLASKKRQLNSPRNMTEKKGEVPKQSSRIEKGTSYVESAQNSKAENSPPVNSQSTVHSRTSEDTSTVRHLLWSFLIIILIKTRIGFYHFRSFILQGSRNQSVTQSEFLKGRERTSELSRKPSSKKRAIETDEGRLERQGTHTILNIEKSRIVELPDLGPSPTKVTEKPKSVVKPMVKDIPLATTAQRTIVRTVSKHTREHMIVLLLSLSFCN
uniref:BTB domain-containing protein n=1 Tax=Heterorhabditis bacteriophora TaxID=37862 RepID=A0A1I7XW47_HETBA